MIAYRISVCLAFACVLATAAMAQSTSTTVTAGPLRGTAEAGPDADLRSDNDRDRTDDQNKADARRDRDCNHRSVTVRSPNGAATASASSSSSNGSTVVAGGGSPGSRTTYDDCERSDRSSRDGDK
jgi:hypothetical protein